MPAKKNRRPRTLRTQNKFSTWHVTLLVGALAVSGTFAALYIYAASVPTRPGWIIAQSAINQLQSVGYPVSKVKDNFSNSHTYIINKSSTTAATNGQATLTFPSYQAMANAFASHVIPASTKAVLYDSESWSATPSIEQHNPAHYYQLAAQLAHQHGLKLIATPAVDLVTVLAPTNRGNRYNTYLSLGIARGAARYADVFDIQAQSAETDRSQYASFVASANSQARSVNPKIVVMAGLSTNPSGQTVTGAQLLAAANSVKGSVNGYWLNIPGGGSQCPACGAPKPQVAVDFLNLLNSAQ